MHARTILKLGKVIHRINFNSKTTNRVKIPYCLNLFNYTFFFINFLNELAYRIFLACLFSSFAI